jgi:hypothetical protein
VFAMSQSISNVLICLTCPLDIVFVLNEQKLLDDGDVVLQCLVFLSVKSAIMLFSVMIISLQGADKAYKVYNISRPYLKVRNYHLYFTFQFVLKTIQLYHISDSNIFLLGSEI